MICLQQLMPNTMYTASGHPSRFPVKLPGSIWGIAAFFNPAGYKNKIANYRLFRESSRRQGLKLIVVEAAFGNAPFELTRDDAEIVVQVRTDSVLWQKERLLNIAREHLPDDCDKVIWTDTDIIFDSPDWIEKTAKLLEEYIVVQPFEKVGHLRKGDIPVVGEHIDISRGDVPAESTARLWNMSGHPGFEMCGRPGFAVAMRRKELDDIGLYDREILCSSDSIMMGAFVGLMPADNRYLTLGKGLLGDADRWCRMAYASVRGSVSYAGGYIFHIWHGTVERRYYGQYSRFTQSFDPQTDLSVGKQGCWEWSAAKSDLRERVKEYFSLRDEDGADSRSAPDLRVHPSRFPVKLPGSIWAIAAFFNPAGYKNKITNYRLFRESSRRQGLKLIVVEAAFGDAPFELIRDDAEIVVQVRTDSVLWQKERLLNIAREHLPDDCDKVIWTDTDIIFQNADWIKETARLLEEYIVVQPFERAFRIGREESVLPDVSSARKAEQVMEGAAFLYSSHDPRSRFFLNGHPGFAISMRRKTLDETGLYDKMIVGGGDAVIMGAFTGVFPEDISYLGRFPEPLIRDAGCWTRQVAGKITGSTTHATGNVFHLWHGPPRRRYYIERGDILDSFDPQSDIRIGSDGCYEWSSNNKAGLHKRVRDYFWVRDEMAAGHPPLQINITPDLGGKKSGAGSFAKRISLKIMPSGSLRRRMARNVYRLAVRRGN